MPRTLFDLAAKRSRQAELSVVTHAPDFWKDPLRASKTQKELADCTEELTFWERITSEATSLLGVAEEIAKQPELAAEVERDLKRLEAAFKAREKLLLFRGPYDPRDAILSLHAGAGGTEAMDWAEMLLRMYLRYAEMKGWRMKLLDESRGEEAGIKSATVEILGSFAYGNLKTEAGVHRLVRLSPFNADHLRQTSFAVVEVLPLTKESAEVAVRDEDLRIDVFRAGGHGGQGVNTADSAVRVTHLPTGIVVSIQNERSQLQNKLTALAIVRAKLLQLQLEEQRKKEAALKTGAKISFGHQIRSYVLHPYKQVKDHRTEVVSGSPEEVLDGNIDSFIEAFLRVSVSSDTRRTITQDGSMSNN
ncbi:MAG: peptide chain release factor 2 [Parcubacteria group bacterium]|nr:peptide chain release factor 2 [Parcubacteria group bacterium]